MKKGKFISSVSLLLVLLTAAVPMFAAAPPAGGNYAECTTPGGTLTTRANLVFQQPKYAYKIVYHYDGLEEKETGSGLEATQIPYRLVTPKNYAGSNWLVDSFAVTKFVTKHEAENECHIFYTKDNNDRNGNPVTGGDGIPDKYQDPDSLTEQHDRYRYTVTYKYVNKETNEIVGQEILQGASSLGSVIPYATSTRRAFKAQNYTLDTICASSNTITPDANQNAVVMQYLSEEVDGPSSEPADEPAQYIVTFDPDNGGAIKSVSVQEGKTVRLPEDPARPGCSFQYWSYPETAEGNVNVEDQPFDFKKPVYSNLGLKAVYKEADNPYAVRDDVSYTVEHYQQTLDNEYILADCEQLTGGESTLVTAGVKSYTGFTENPGHPDRVAGGVVNAADPLILRLYYDRNLYQVTIDSGTGQPIVLEVRYGDLVHKPDASPSKDGAAFKGWVDKSTQEPVDWNEPVTDNRYITASFLPKDAGSSGGSGSHDGSGGGSGSHSGGSSGGSASAPKDQEEAPKDNLSDTILNKKDHIRYISGYPDGTVRPMKNITRGEVAQIIYRLMQPAFREANFSDTNPYSDAGAAVWCNDAVSTLTRAKLIQGYGDGTFGCNRDITRAEFAAVMSRFFTLTGGTECLFTDIDPHWAKADIEKAASLGYIKGKTRTIFDPDEPITRAEAAAILNRVLERGAKAGFMLDGMKRWPDNPAGAWYYEDMQEASNGHNHKIEDGHEVWTGLTGN